MKAMFAHDHKFIHAKDRTAVLSPGKLPYNVLARYLKHVDELLVVARLGESAECESLTSASGPGITFHLLPDLVRPRAFLSGSRRIQHELDDIVKEVDAVVARIPSIIGGLAAKAARRLGKPFALEVVGCAWDACWNHGPVLAKVYAPLAFLEAREVVSLSDRTLYVTEGFLQRRYPCVGTGVACSDVELGVVDEVVLKQRTRRLHANLPSPFRLGMIGSLSTAVKGFGVILAALAMLRRAGISNLSVEILGGGDGTKWRQLASKLGVDEDVAFIGTMPGGQSVFDWLDSLDLYLQPSLAEGLPRALIEAMSRACPVLGSTAGGIPELLAADCLHKPGDAKTLSRQIEYAVENRDWRITQATRNFEVAQRYTRVRLDDIRDRFWGGFFRDARTRCGSGTLQKKDCQTGGLL